MTTVWLAKEPRTLFGKLPDRFKHLILGNKCMRLVFRKVIGAALKADVLTCVAKGRDNV